MDFCKITAWQKFTLEFLKLSFGNGAIALRSGNPLLQAKKHDRKIKITDIAILNVNEKVSHVITNFWATFDHEKVSHVIMNH